MEQLPVSDLDTPAFVIDLDRLERNLDAMAQLTRQAGVKLRPHVKTHKSPLIARRQLDRGAVGIAVAKLGEAEVMADAGITDILIAYPIVGEPKLRRLADLCRRTEIRVAVDSVAVATGISQVGRQVGRDIPVYLEVDTGLHRMGLQPGEPVVRLARAVRDLGALEVVGVMGHAGHVDAASTPEDAARVGDDDARTLVATAESLRQAGFDIREVSPGSTPTTRQALGVPGVTEVRPGTYVFNDVNTVARWAATWEDCAAWVVATVVSRPAADRLVIDAGSKVLSRDPSLHPEVPGFGRVRNHPGLVLDRLSEEHGVVRIGPRGSALKVGDRLEVIPNHVCTSLANFEVAYGVRRGQVETMIPIAARGKFQ